MTAASSRTNGQYVSLVDLTRLLLAHKWIIIASLFVFLLLFAAYDQLRSKRYSSIATLAYVETDPNDARLAGLAQQFGSIASLAGLGGSAPSTSKQEAIATLRSRIFLESFIEDNELLPTLYSGRWDKQSGRWLDKYADDIPTLQDGYQKFKRRILTVTEDLNTGLITIEIVWGNPELAATWANQLVRRVNERLRSEAIVQSNNKIEYLQGQLEEASQLELRSAIFSLIEGQIQSRMLAKVNKEYALRTIDPARPSDTDKFTGPTLLLLLIVGTFLGVVFGVFLVLLKNFVALVRSPV